MKKLLMGLLLMLPLCGFAQKGMQGVGVNFGFGCCFAYGDYASSYGINYQNFVTDRFRLVSSLEVLNYTYCYDWTIYETPAYEYATSCLLVVEGHYFFNDIRRLRPYVVGGVSVGFLETTGWRSEFAGGVKLGVGLNYRISYHLTAQLEVPIHLVYYNPLFTPSLGLVYTF